MDYTKFFDQDGKGTHDVLSFRLVFDKAQINWMQRVQNCFDAYTLCCVPGAEIHYLAEKTEHISTAHFVVTIPNTTDWQIWMSNLIHFSALLGRCDFRVASGFYSIENFIIQNPSTNV